MKFKNIYNKKNKKLMFTLKIDNATNSLIIHCFDEVNNGLIRSIIVPRAYLDRVLKSKLSK